MMRDIEIYFLAIKYWLRGDEWGVALEYARAIVKGFKRGGRTWS